MADAMTFAAVYTGTRIFSFLMKPEGTKRGLKVEVAVNPAQAPC